MFHRSVYDPLFKYSQSVVKKVANFNQPVRKVPDPWRQSRVCLGVTGVTPTSQEAVAPCFLSFTAPTMLSTDPVRQGR